METIIVGDLVLAFDCKDWNKVGHDVGDNSCFYKKAIIKTIRPEINGDRIVADVEWLDNKQISKGHFLTALTKI
jgi:multidrug resistance efflux pump